MSNDSADLNRVINQVRDFFEEISKLLLTADALMSKGGWNPMNGNTCTSELSYSLNTPRQWMPNYLCRFYRHRDYPSLLPCVSVILGAIDDDPKLVQEPLVSGCLFDYGKDNIVKDWGMRYCNWHIYTSNRKDDGTICAVDPRSTWPEEKSLAHKLSSFALPLLSIIDSNSLRESVIDRISNLCLEARS